jgi:hypothetical protein
MRRFLLLREGTLNFRTAILLLHGKSTLKLPLGPFDLALI